MDSDILRNKQYPRSGRILLNLLKKRKEKVIDQYELERWISLKDMMGFKMAGAIYRAD